MRRLWIAFGYSVAGLRAAWNQPAIRLECWLLAVAIPLALSLPLDIVKQLLLIGSVMAVFVVEILNCAVEAAIDRISYDRHPLSKAAKDLGSAAVLVAAVLAGIVWIALMGPLFLPH